MTKETTASQPKSTPQEKIPQESIGDDAQFHALMSHHNYAQKNGDFDQRFAARKNLVSFIDSRAPADQASATIQAAPEDRNAVLEDAIQAVIALHNATESDIKQQAFRKAINEIDALKSAAPMVADPAGVARNDALDEAAKLVIGCDKRADLRGIACAIRSLKSELAATVKAVPSEALEGCEHCLHTYCLSSEICRHCGDVNGTQGYKGGKLASPLADKPIK